jgi:hypothetical protein
MMDGVDCGGVLDRQVNCETDHVPFCCLASFLGITFHAELVDKLLAACAMTSMVDSNLHTLDSHLTLFHPYLLPSLFAF